jgi:hypothetical protein
LGVSHFIPAKKKNVTSRSGALTKLILWGHLLASDLDFYDDEPLNLDDDAS